MAKNTRGKRRDVEKPYEVYTAGDWEWRVLKHYQSPEGERKNKFARVLCAVQSPFTFGTYEYGDTYCKDIPGYVYK